MVKSTSWPILANAIATVMWTDTLILETRSWEELIRHAKYVRNFPEEATTDKLSKIKPSTSVGIFSQKANMR